MGMCAKLAHFYYWPFKSLERIGPMAYRLSLHPIVRDHNLFNASLLRKYVHDFNHVIDWTMIQV